MHRPQLSVSPLGWWVVVTGALSWIVGWRLGWIELSVVAVGCLLAMLIAVPFVIGSGELQLDRVIEPDHVEVGERASSQLTIRNVGTATSASRSVEDRIGAKRHIIDVPALAPGAVSEAVLSLPTKRRGVVDVGPAVMAKSDPLGLLRRELGRSGTDRLWVHPRVVPLAPLRSGFAKDLEGPTHDTSPAGDIAFHAIREYAIGDDHRRVHWLSTARTGTLMVRHYVDNRRPNLAVLVDPDADVYDGELFESALEIAASQVVAAFIEQRPIALWFGSECLIGESKPGTRNGTLDELCLVQASSNAGELVGSVNDLLRIEHGLSAVLVVTGGRDRDELHAAVQTARRHCPVIVARLINAGEQPVILPRSRTINASGLDEFAAAWRRSVR